MPRLRSPINIAQPRHRYVDPNFTAILPGKCQARCRFCLEPEGPPPISNEFWLDSLRALVTKELPPTFRTVSISGGEPTLSPVFENALRILSDARSQSRVKRVVLTTNGNAKGLRKHMAAIGAAVTNVNISRHAADDFANARVFKTHNVPNGDQLRELIESLSVLGIPVNLNCVYSPEHAFGRAIASMDADELRVEAEHYITFARTAGATSVVFRHDHRVWQHGYISPLERVFDDVAVVHRAECESCRVIGKIVRGMPVNFKQSAHETVDKHYEGELYELVLHSDGILYRDWSRRHPVERPLVEMRLNPYELLDQRGLDTYLPSRQLMFIPECEPKNVPCDLLVSASDVT